MQHHSSDACSGQSSKATDPTGNTSSTSFAETCTCCNAKNLHYTESSVNCPSASCRHFEADFQLDGYQPGYKAHQPTAPSAPAITSSSYDMASSSANPHHHQQHHQQQQSSYLHCHSGLLRNNNVATSASAANQAYLGPRDSSSSSSAAPTSVSSSFSQNSRGLVEYVYELPYDVRKEVCDLLDADGNWRKLGGIYMKFNDTQLTLFSHAFYRNESPTNQMLMKWESSNGKVAQLYSFLGNMNHRRAMQHLRPFVEEKWRLLYDSENSSALDGNAFELNFSTDRQSFYPPQNFNSQQFQRQQSYIAASSLPPGSNSFADHQQNLYSFESNLAAELLANKKQQQQQHQKHHAELSSGTKENFSSCNANQLLPTFTGSFTGKPNFVAANQANNNFGDMISQNRHFLHDIPHHLRHAKNSFTGHSGDNSSGDHTLVDINNSSRMRAISGSSSQQGRFSEAANRLKQEKLEYLVRIEDFEIPYKELAIATDDFCNDRILGSGGFGTVYIGEWKGTKVAVKKLKGLDNSAQAFTELRVLNCCRIDNILPLYAVALDGPEPCLVYQYMCNGSLEDRLLCKSGTTPLTWIQRAKIGEGIARALNFLHTLKGNPFVHGDVKSANILLDAVFEPKLGDFGLARKVEKRGENKNDSLYTHCTVSSVNGTSVYLPSEYLRNKILSPAVDVYSYGIVILEMATGRRAYDGKRLLIHSVEDEYMSLAKVASNVVTKTISTGNNSSSGDDLQEASPPPVPSVASTSASSSPTSNIITTTTATTVNSIVHENLMDRRIVHLPNDRHWFNCLLELGRKCAHKVKSKRPLMVQVLEYFNQCKTTDRIHKLVDKRSVAANMLPFSCKSVLLKSPLELQLWYDFVRQSCGPHLSDVVFENFGAQVTRMIEDFNSSCEFAETTTEQHQLKQNVNLKNNSILKVKQKHQKKINIRDRKPSENEIPIQKSTSNCSQLQQKSSSNESPSFEVARTTTAATVPASSLLVDQPTESSSSISINSSSTNSSSSLSPLHLPQLLQLMTMASSDDGSGGGSGSSTAISSASTIEDELSLFSGSDVDAFSSKMMVNSESEHHSTSNVDDTSAQQRNNQNSPVRNKSGNFEESENEAIANTKSENKKDKVVNAQQNTVNENEEEDSNMPFIPLLTALGFANDDIEEIVSRSGKLKQFNSSTFNIENR